MNRITSITERLDPHPNNGFTDAEMERDALAFAEDHSLLDVIVTIDHFTDDDVVRGTAQAGGAA